MTEHPAVGGAGRFHADAVAIGEIGVARGAGVLRTFLGSCVGVSLHDRRHRVGALAHVVLPDSQGNRGSPGRFADTAIPEMIRLIREAVGGQRLGLEAKLVGGAKMFAFQTGVPIGEQNRQAVERILAAHGIPILGSACGGSQGRRMTVVVATGGVTAETVGGDVVEL